MSEWRETFALIAEVSVAITGFSALIGVVFRQRQMQWRTEDYNRLQRLLQYSIGGLGACLLPFLVFDWIQDESTGWRVSSGVVLAVFAAWAFYQRHELKWWSRQRDLIVTFFGVGDVLLKLVLAVNVSELFFEANAQTYAILIYWSVLGAVAGFAKVIALTWHKADEEDA